MTHALHIRDGIVHDPANGIDGDVRDLFIVDGKVVDALPDGIDAHVIDARGAIVMPGGVEMHAHIASTTVNTARRIQGATGYDPVVPTAMHTGVEYARLGYTTAIEPAVPPESARVAHWQLHHIPILDAGILTLLGNHEGLIGRLASGDRTAAAAMLRDLLARTGAFGIKAVNPAGVSAWRKDPSQTRVASIDDCIRDTNISPRAMLEWFTQVQDELNLSHPTHIHGPQLGEPGNVEITCDMVRALGGRRFHLAHLQYYAYGKTKQGGIKSAVEPLLDALCDAPDATFDLGLVAFGPAFTATSDLPLEYGLYQHAGAVTRPASFFESGNEDCFGVMPLRHAPGNPIHALQWAIGLELALLNDDPWRMALTVDHPNGGSFMNYPDLIALLMDKSLRDQTLTQVNSVADQRTGLASITREYSLNEIAIITRAAPAKALGLKNKGHLGAGADADVTLYDAEHARVGRFAKLFAQPRMTIKAGRILVRAGACSDDLPAGNRLRAAVESDAEADRLVARWLDDIGSISPGQYGLSFREITAMQECSLG